MARSVRAPDGRSWRVRRHWAARAPRWRSLLRWPKERRRTAGDRGSSDIDVGDGLHLLDAFDEALAPVVIVLAIVIAAVVFVLFGIPLIIYLLDVLLIVVLGGASVVTKILFRRPWTIEAATHGPPPESRTWKIVGLRTSRRFIHEIEAAVRGGHALPEGTAGPLGKHVRRGPFDT